MLLPLRSIVVKRFLPILLLGLAGCASINQEPAWFNPSVPQSELMVYRAASDSGKFTDAYFGSLNNYVVALGEKEYATIVLPAGEQTFRVAGQGSRAVKITTKLKAKRSACMRIEAEPTTQVLMGQPAYKAEIVKCPSDAYIASLKKVKTRTFSLRKR